MSTFAVHLLSRRRYMPNCNRLCRKRVGSIFFIRYFKHLMYDETLFFSAKSIEKSRSMLFFCINNFNDFYMFKQFLKNKNKSHHFYEENKNHVSVCIKFKVSINRFFRKYVDNLFFK